MTVDDILVGYIFTLTYVNRHPNRDFHTKARKSRFLRQTGSTDSQYAVSYTHLTLPTI